MQNRGSAPDHANRVSSILNCKPDGSPLVYFEYEYDPASRIASIRRENGDIIYYGYDDADRLTGETWKAQDHSTIYAFQWDYDAVGNRTYQSRDGVLATATLEPAAVPPEPCRRHSEGKRFRACRRFV